MLEFGGEECCAGMVGVVVCACSECSCEFSFNYCSVRGSWVGRVVVQVLERVGVFVVWSYV